MIRPGCYVASMICLFFLTFLAFVLGRLDRD